MQTNDYYACFCEFYSILWLLIVVGEWIWTKFDAVPDVLMRSDDATVVTELASWFHQEPLELF